MARNYEMVYVLSPALNEEELQAAKDRVAQIVSGAAEVNEVQDWGRKRLAYEIEDFKEGVYGMITFAAEGNAPAEIERVMNITEHVLRFLIVRQGA